jgi:Dyp-type peroxidase family
MSVAEPLRIENIQSEILRGYRRGDDDPAPAAGCYLLLRFGNTRLREFLQTLVGGFAISSFETWHEEKSVNVGLTFRGLEILCAGAADMFAKDDPFVQGMCSRAERLLADHGDSAPAHWEFSDGSTGRFIAGVECVVMVQGASETSVLEAASGLADVAGRLGASVVLERGSRLERNRESFGYVDGIAQPALDGLRGPIPGYGVVDSRGKWRPVRIGEIVGGYTDESGPFAGPNFLIDGSFVALRKLRQDVAGFHEYLSDQAKRTGLKPADVAAKMMGRTFDGAPLGALESHGEAFRYASDATGFSCPHGAHIRRANPRDVVNRFGDGAERHRIVRRALMYAYDWQGSPRDSVRHRSFKLEVDSPPSQGGDGLERGMLFAAFNASLERQFEFLQGNWLNRGETERDRLFTFRDSVTGANDGRGFFFIPGDEIKILDQLPRFVTTAGGAYLFFPSLNVLGVLAAESADERTALRDQAKALLARRRLEARPQAEPPKTARNQALFSGGPPPKLTLSAQPAAGAAVVGSGPAWLRRLLGKTQPPTPEEKVLIVMAPIQERAALAADLATQRYRDAVGARLAGVSRRDEKGRPVPLIQHARFVVADDFVRWHEEKGMTSPERLPLPNAGGYLLFVCWSEVRLPDLCRALAAEWVKEGAQLPLARCYGFPTDVRPQKALADALYAYFRKYSCPTAFVYQGYADSAATIQKALRLRTNAVALIRDATPKNIGTLLDKFFTDNEHDLD